MIMSDSPEAGYYCRPNLPNSKFNDKRSSMDEDDQLKCLVVEPNELLSLRAKICSLYPDKKVMVSPSMSKLYISRHSTIIDNQGKTSPDWVFFANGIVSIVYDPHQKHDFMLTFFEKISNRLLWCLRWAEYVQVEAHTSNFHVINTQKDFSENVGVLYENRDVAELILNAIVYLKEGEPVTQRPTLSRKKSLLRRFSFRGSTPKKASMAMKQDSVEECDEEESTCTGGRSSTPSRSSTPIDDVRKSGGSFRQSGGSFRASGSFQLQKTAATLVRASENTSPILSRRLSVKNSPADKSAAAAAVAAVRSRKLGRAHTYDHNALVNNNNNGTTHNNNIKKSPSNKNVYTLSEESSCECPKDNGYYGSSSAPSSKPSSHGGSKPSSRSERTTTTGRKLSRASSMLNQARKISLRSPRTPSPVPHERSDEDLESKTHALEIGAQEDAIRYSDNDASMGDTSSLRRRGNVRQRTDSNSGSKRMMNFLFSQRRRISRSQSLRLPEGEFPSSSDEATDSDDVTVYGNDVDLPESLVASFSQKEKYMYQRHKKLQKQRPGTDSLLLKGSTVRCVIDTGLMARYLRERKDWGQTLQEGDVESTDLCVTEL